MKCHLNVYKITMCTAALCRQTTVIYHYATLFIPIYSYLIFIIIYYRLRNKYSKYITMFYIISKNIKYSL